MPRRSCRQAIEQADRRAQVSRLTLIGLKPAQIADKLGHDPKTVYRDLEAIKQEWRKRANAAYNEHVADEMAKLDLVERVALERLQEAPKATAALLKVVTECIRQRRDLLGLDRPKRIELSGPDGKLMGIGVGSLTDEQLLDIATGGGGGVAQTAPSQA